MSPSPHLDDDRLSALCDGEAPEGDVAHAATCAECGALVAAWRRASQLVSVKPDAPPSAQRDAAVAAALAAADRLDGHDEIRPPVPLAGRRARRALMVFVSGRAIAAAAAIIVIVGIAVAVSHSGISQSSKSSSGPAAASGASSATTVAGSANPVPGTSPGVSAASNSFGALQGDQDAASLTAALRAALADRDTATITFSGLSPAAQGAAQSAAQTCLSRAVADARVPPGSTPVLNAVLTYGGSPAEAMVFTTGGGYIAAVVAVPGCGLLADVTW